MLSMVEALATSGEPMARSEFASCMERALGRATPELQGNEVLAAMLGAHGSKRLLLSN